MTRKKCCIVVLLGCSIVGMRSLAFEEEGFAWSIGSPAASPQETFSGNIPASGGVGYSKAYVLRVEATDGTVLSGTNGNGTPSSWSATVSEPNNGWCPGNLTYMQGIIRLIVDGEPDNTVAIQLLD